MAKSTTPHVPTMMVVGLGMILIASLAAVAALAWAQSRAGSPLLARPRRRRPEPDLDEDDVVEGASGRPVAEA